MTDRVLLVTAPDDIQLDGLRLLLVDLAPEHTQVISDALGQFEELPNVITYIWRNGDPTDWLIDKKHKSQIIIFNADCENQTIVGYMAAQKQSHYFGLLKNLSQVNDSAIYTTEDCFNLITQMIKNYE